MLLQELLGDDEMDSVLVFARTKRRADRVAQLLQRANIEANVLHGDRSQSQRIQALESFRRKRTRVLVATDIAARGIDVQGISHVINYDVPMQPEDYVHRIGRTAPGAPMRRECLYAGDSSGRSMVCAKLRASFVAGSSGRNWMGWITARRNSSSRMRTLFDAMWKQNRRRTMPPKGQLSNTWISSDARL